VRKGPSNRFQLNHFLNLRASRGAYPNAASRVRARPVVSHTPQGAARSTGSSWTPSGTSRMSVAIVTQQPLPRCSIPLVAANFLGQLADMPLLFFYQCVTVIEPSLTDPSS